MIETGVTYNTKKRVPCTQNTMQQNPKKDYLYLTYKGKEYLWLVFLVLSVILSVYSLIQGDREQSIYFIVLMFFAGLLYSFNRSRRKKLQNKSYQKKED
ncbi:MAG: hypothetical protein JST67_06805 [Bacteroidetes bacterium]|nr:hypothetical protein [Bacteroidota bacterium]